MDYEYKNYHDNRAFQFHNNNTLTKGKNTKAATATKIYGLPINDSNTLDVVIVQSKSGSGNYAGRKLLETIPNHNSNSICNRKEHGGNEKTSSICRRHQRRRKHNATQTPLVAAGWKHLGDDGSCTGIGLGGVTCPSCLSICTMSSCVKHAHCFHHGEQHIGAGAGRAELTCHCHITHHCHQYSPSGQSSRKGKHHQRQCRHHASKRATEQCDQAQHHHQHHHQQNHISKEQQQQQHKHQNLHSHHRGHHRQNCQNSPSPYARQLPAENRSGKSSIDSSAEQLCQQPLRQSQCQEIAIEIDAATMTEDNGSTATSNFAYKMAKDPKENQRKSQYGEKLTPYNCRRASFNSNTTIETDELSRDDDDDDEQREHDEIEELTPRRNSARTENNSSATPRAICCDLDDGSCLEQDADGVAYCPYGVPLSNDVHNECVRIKRKRFLPHEADFCSSCSSCSCARCDDNTSSCSSLDDDDLGDFNNSVADDGRPSHEFTVSAECHHCNLPRQSSSASTMGEADDELDDQDRPDRRIVSARSISSTHTSRRSSESFCSCNSNSCNHCSCSCEECDTTGRMRTAREGLSNATEAPFDLEEQHSSTLTPLTNPSSIVSTPLADDAAADVTIRSGNSNIFGADDASSLSQSAEYFSIASSNQQSRSTPTITPVHKPSVAISSAAAAKSSKGNNSEYVVPPAKQCKHYSKHHRHKYTETKPDGYL